MNDAEFDAFEDAMDDQAQRLREALAADIGGDPEEYRVRRGSDGE